MKRHEVYLLAVVLFLLMLAIPQFAHSSPPFSIGITPLDKAMEAGYVQSGVERDVNIAQDYLLNNYAKPYDLDKIAVPFLVYKRKEFAFKIWREDRLKLQPDRATISIPF